MGPHRREAILRLGSGLVLRPGLRGGQRAGEKRDSDSRRPDTPDIAHPIRFDKPEADGILASFQVFPPDNPWNADISRWPVHPDSRKIIASIGSGKPLRYNPDMGFVLV